MPNDYKRRGGTPNIGTGNVIAMVADKGGVGKSITAINLSSGLARYAAHFGYNWRVLVVDVDPQSTTFEQVSGWKWHHAVGEPLPPVDPARSIAALLRDERGRLRPQDFVQASPWVPDHLYYIPSDRASLLEAGDAIRFGINGEGRLQRALRPLRDTYHFIIVDTRGWIDDVLTKNALLAAKHVLIPLNSDNLGLDALPRTLDTLDVFHAQYGPQPDVLGILMTIYRRGVGTATEGEALLRKAYKDLVFRTVIPENNALPDATNAGVDIFTHKSSASGALAYAALMEEVILRIEGRHNGKG